MEVIEIEDWFLKYPELLMYLSEYKPMTLSRSMKKYTSIWQNFNVQGQILMSILKNILQNVEYGLVFGIADHENKGDAGINWSQYMVFKHFNINIVYYCTSNKIHKICDINEAYRIANNLPKKPVIFLTGGGNLGNLWPLYEEERKEILDKFKNFEAFIFPQSIAIKKKVDFDYIKEHNKLTILVRDLFSYNYIKNILPNEITEIKHSPKLYLTPDIVTSLITMRENVAIYQDNSTYKYYNWDVIWINRKDRELKEKNEIDIANFNTTLRVKVDDWVKFSPTSYQNRFFDERSNLYIKSIELKNRNRYIESSQKIILNPDFDDFSLIISLERFCKGLKFILQGKMLISNRLHGHIFSSLLNKSQILLDTKYNKVTNYYNTWSFSINENYVKVVNSNEDALKSAELLIENIEVDNSNEIYYSYCNKWNIKHK